MMNFEDMFSSAIFAIINIVFIFIIAIMRTKNKEKYPGLKCWIYGATLQVSSFFFFVLRDLIQSGFIKTSITFVGNIILLVSYIIILHCFLELVGRQIEKKYTIIAGVIMSVLLFYATVITYNGTIITIVVLLSLFFTNISMLVAVHYKKNRQQITRWSSFSIINGLALVFTLFYFIYVIFAKGNSISCFLLYKGENYLLKSVILSATMNSIGLVTVMNSNIPSYVDLENHLFSDMFYNIPFIVIAVDTKSGLIKYVNPEFSKALGYKKEEVVDILNLEDIHGNMKQYEELKALFYENKSFGNAEILYKTKDNRQLYGTTSVTSMLFEEGEFLIGSIVNITETVIAKKVYKKLAMYDELTKLPNRRPFIEKFNEKVQDQKPFMVLILDLDNFKDLNDKYGHNYGDKVLKVIGKKLSIYNDSDNIVARYGGDEFVILLSIKRIEESQTQAKEILKLFEEEIIVNNTPVKVNASIGYSMYPYDGMKIETLLIKADKALYQAKRSSGNYACKYSIKLNKQ